MRWWLALFTPANFLEHYPLLTGAGEDTVLTTLIERVDENMARWCRYPRADDGTWTLESATYTRHRSHPVRGKADALDVGVFPITAVTSVHVDADRAFGAGALLTEGTDFEVDPRRGWLWLLPGGSGDWASAPRANRVICTAGYATTPPGLIAIGCGVLRHLWDLRQRQGMQSTSMDNFSAAFSDDTAGLIPEQFRADLEWYRLPEPT